MTDAMPEGWTDFFVAIAGAAGALAGLIIVAMTVNIQTILGIPSMTSRAAATIASLVLIVVTAAAGLIPGQGAVLLGAEVALFTAGALGLSVDAGIRMIGAAEPPYVGVTWVKTGVAILQIVPFAVGAVILLTGSFTGLYWIAAGVLLVFIGSVANAWVLLVEILR
jgi:hypothetical protein